MAWEITYVTDCRDCFVMSAATGYALNCALHLTTPSTENVEYTDTPLDRPMPGDGKRAALRRAAELAAHG